MDKTKLEAEFALHEFSVRYRAALAKQFVQSEQNYMGIRDAVREQHLAEQHPTHGIEAPAIEGPKIEAPDNNKSGIEAPKIQEPKIEAPKIEPPKQPRGPGIEPEI